MKIIFLDHLGVVCLADKHSTTKQPHELPNPNDYLNHGVFSDFNKEAVNVLNSILNDTDTEIIVSSDWKKHCDVNKMGEFYISQGIIKKPVGFTPNLPREKLTIQKHRSVEISTYVEKHPEITKWVAVDDLYMGAYLTNFVWVSHSDEGLLQPGVKEKILSYLL